jgi:1,4-alpha-glucan branching enzyme
MPGDDWQRFANLRALYGWMWALPGAPLLFMGGEIAPWTEWSESSGLPWHLFDHAPHRGICELIATLNAISAAHPAVWAGDNSPGSFRWLDADDAQNSVYAFVRHAPEGSVICVVNFTPNPRPGYRVGAPHAGEWTVLIDTDGHRFGGSGYRGDDTTVMATTEMSWQGQPASILVDLPPLGVVWLGS